MFRLTSQADVVKMFKRVEVKQVMEGKVVVVADMDIIAKLELKVEITTPWITKILDAMAAKTKDELQLTL